MAYICYKPKDSCHGCEHYRFDDDRQRMACFAEYDEKQCRSIKKLAARTQKQEEHHAGKNHLHGGQFQL